MMTVVGEEGTPIDDFEVMLKAEFFDSVYLQQNAFDPVDAATPRQRQEFVFGKVLEVMNLEFDFEDKDSARKIMFRVTDLFRNWNYAPWLPEGEAAHEADAEADKGEEEEQPEAMIEGRSEEFKRILGEIDAFIEAKGRKGETSESENAEEERKQPAAAAE